jgi:phosphoribosylformylglycinamidine cyclo-ligase
MYQVFNCGHRMELYVNPNVAQQIIDISRSFDVDAQIIGRVEQAPKKCLTIKGPYGTFEY